MVLDEVLKRLDNVRGGNGQYTARCPGHDDRQNSLSVADQDGRILMFCHAGCDTRAVLDRMGLCLEDLYPPVQRSSPNETYLYREGQLRKVKVRQEDGSKFCYWQHWTPSGWQSGRNGLEPGLFYEVHHETAFLLVEGEKDVRNLHGAGYSAVSLPDGAGSKWRPEYDAFFEQKDVVLILPDNDRAGWEYARMCHRELKRLGIRTGILDLKRLWADLPEKGDISDALQMVPQEELARFLANPANQEPEEFEDLGDIEVPFPEEPNRAELEAVEKLLIRGSEAEKTEPKWLIYPYISRGTGTMIQAEPGVGKTAFACALAACVTTGKPLMGLPIEETGNVVMLSTEDESGILRARFEASGGDVNRVFFLRSHGGIGFNAPELETILRVTRPKLLVFDPFQQFIGSKTNMNQSNETHPILEALFRLCAKYDCACVIVAHITKMAQGKSMMYMSLGSVDIPGIMRSILHAAKNPRDKTERVLFHIKSSYAPNGKNIHYRIVDQGGVEFVGFSETEPEELLAPKKEEFNPYEQEPLVEVLNKLMEENPKGGFFSYADVKAYAQKVMGFLVFEDARELSRRLTPQVLKRLMEDGVHIETGQTFRGARGIRATRYRLPEGYQTEIEA